MVIYKQKISDIKFNEVVSGEIIFNKCTITGGVEENGGEGTIKFVDCKFPNGLSIINNTCRIIIETAKKR